MTPLLSVAFLCALALSSPKCSTVDECAQPVYQGDEVPFTGQLLSTELAIAIGQKAEKCDERIKIDVGFAKKEAGLDLEHEKRLRAINQDAHALELGAVQADRDRWKELADTPFYEKPWFVVTITAVVVGAIFVGASQVPGR